jgi:hypothetical protein
MVAKTLPIEVPSEAEELAMEVAHRTRATAFGSAEELAEYEAFRVSHDMDMLRLVLAAYAYTYIPDLISAIDWPEFKRLVAMNGGLELKIPSAQQVERVRADYRLVCEIDQEYVNED